MAPELWPHNHLRGWKSTIRSLNICWLWNGRFVGFQAAGLRKLPVARMIAANWQDPLCSTFAQRHHCSVSSHSNILLKMFSSQSLNNDLSDLFWMLIWMLRESLGNSSRQPRCTLKGTVLSSVGSAHTRLYTRQEIAGWDITKEIWTGHFQSTSCASFAMCGWLIICFHEQSPHGALEADDVTLVPLPGFLVPFNAKTHLPRNCTFKIMWEKKR